MVSGNDHTSQITPLRFLLVILALIFVSFPGVVLGSHSFFYRDAGLFTYPLALYCRDSIWNGEMPLWNPLNNCGLPLLAQWNTVLCYPLSLIWVVLPLPWSMSLFLLLHLFIAAYGMYRLALSMTGSNLGAAVAGLVFAFNGLTLHSLMWASNLPAYAWMPWIFIFVQRAVEKGGLSIFYAAILGALQMLAGSPEVTLFTWCIVFLYHGSKILKRQAPFKNTGLVIGSIVLLVALLSAVQLLPFFQLLSHANRGSGFEGDVWSMPAWGFANFIVPLFKTTPSVVGIFSQDEQQWTASYYVGILPVLLAGVALSKRSDKKILFFTGVALLGLLLAMGSHAVLYDIVRTVFPPIGFFRYPVKFIVITLFSLPLLAAYGVKSCENSEVLKRVSLGVVMLFVLVCGVLLIAYFFPSPGEVWNATRQNGVMRICFLIVGAVLLCLLKRSIGKTKVVVSYALLIALGWDIVTHAPLLQPTLPSTVYQPMKFDMVPVPRFGESRAMLSPHTKRTMERSATEDWMNYYLGQRSVLMSNCNLLDGIPKVDGFFSLSLQKQSQVQSSIYSGRINPPLLDFLGVSQTTTDRMFEWVPRNGYYPLITGGQVPVYLPEADTLSRLLSPAFQPTAQVFLPESAHSEVVATNGSTVKIESPEYSSHRVAFGTSAAQPALVVIAQSFYPAWKAYVDGEESKLFPANHAFQAVQVPAGKHSVEICYEDRAFKTGTMISAVTFLGCLAGIVIIRRRMESLPAAH